MTQEPIPDEDDLRLNRVGASYELQFAAHLRDKSMEQAISMGAWLVASLLALNGGGALAVLNAVDRLAQPTVPASIFIAGIMFALANAAGIQWSGYAQLKPMSEMIGYWITVADDGVRTAAFEDQLKAKVRPLIIRGKLASAAGWISAFLFLAGCVCFATNFEPTRVTDNSMAGAAHDEAVPVHKEH